MRRQYGPLEALVRRPQLAVELFRERKVESVVRCRESGRDRDLDRAQCDTVRLNKAHRHRQELCHRCMKLVASEIAKAKTLKQCVRDLTDNVRGGNDIAACEQGVVEKALGDIRIVFFDYPFDGDARIDAEPLLTTHSSFFAALSNNLDRGLERLAAAPAENGFASATQPSE